MEFLVLVHQANGSWFVDGQLADSANEACALVCKERKDVQVAMAFAASDIQTTINALKLVAKAVS